MLLKKFIDNAGFKILSMAQLSSCEYSIIFYLLNCLASGLKQIIITDHELATNIGFPGADSIKALEQLVEKNLMVGNHEQELFHCHLENLSNY